jgi:hypothetical protein
MRGSNLVSGVESFSFQRVVRCTQLMGHANVDTTLNVYTQVLDASVRAAVETVGRELFTIVQSPGETPTLIH